MEQVTNTLPSQIVNLSSQENTPFSAAAVAHPAMVDKGDAPGIKIPYLMLPSGEEPKDDVAAWEKEVKVDHKVEWFEDQVHGWMAARSDLSKENVKKEYQRGYQLVLEWFQAHL